MTNQNNTNTSLRDNEKPSNCEERERNSSFFSFLRKKRVARVCLSFFCLFLPSLLHSDSEKRHLRPKYPNRSPPKRAKALKKAGFLKKSNPTTTSKKKSCALSRSKENARFLKQKKKNRTNTHSSSANLSSIRSRRIRAHSNAREFRFFNFFFVVLCRRVVGLR